MSGRLEGRVALVTGAASGLGRAAAERFVREGASVAFADRDKDGARAAADSASPTGARVLALHVDVADLSSAQGAVTAAEQQLGPVDVLLHCAGIAGDGSAATLDSETWQRVITVNLTGTWHMARAVLPGMLQRGRGSIINMASVAGLVGVPGIAPYAAAKGGVIALTRQMAVDYAHSGVRVNAICPGTVPTPLVLGAYAARGELDLERAQEALDAAAQRRYPMQRLGTPQDVASLAVFLASDESAWITGVAHPLDGGLSAAGWLVGR
jgi:NAD(P)-dependent dehydrogenase (short-subunit alcohol dehydrogenase family)